MPDPQLMLKDIEPLIRNAVHTLQINSYNIPQSFLSSVAAPVALSGSVIEEEVMLCIFVIITMIG